MPAAKGSARTLLGPKIGKRNLPVAIINLIKRSRCLKTMRKRKAPSSPYKYDHLDIIANLFCTSYLNMTCLCFCVCIKHIVRLWILLVPLILVCRYYALHITAWRIFVVCSIDMLLEIKYFALVEDIKPTQYNTFCFAFIYLISVNCNKLR